MTENHPQRQVQERFREYIPDKYRIRWPRFAHLRWFRQGTLPQLCSEKYRSRIRSHRYFALPITADKAVIFSLQSRNSVPYRNHLKWANPGQRILFLPGREGRLCAGRVNICHGDETRKAGGPNPDWFPLWAHRNVWHIWTRTGHLSFSDWLHDETRPLLTQPNSNMANLNFHLPELK